MSRNFNNVDQDRVDLGDVTASRFLVANNWATFAFFRIENSATDDRTILAKWGTGLSTRQFRVRTDAQTAPTNLEVYSNDNIRITGGDNVALNTWYFLGISHAASGNVTLYLFDMAGTVLDDGLTGSWFDDTDPTGEITIGGRATSADPMDGDVAWAGYLQQEITKTEFLEIMRAPRSALRYSPEWLLPLGLGSPEPDWSGKGNNGTVTGSTIGNNPPVAPWFGLDSGWHGAFGAAAGPSGFPIHMSLLGVGA